MKSLLFTIEFPPQKGGISKYYENICEYLPAEKISVLTSHEINDKKFDDKQKYTIYRKNLICALPIWPKWIFSFFHLWKTVKKGKIDIILVGQILPLGTVAYIYKKIFKMPYGIFIHGMDIQMAQRNLRKAKLAKKILNNAKFIIANSKYTKKLVIKQEINESKIQVVYPIVNTQSYTKQNTNEHESKGEIHQPCLLTIGRLVKRKGQDMVIKALPKVLEKLPGVKYIMAGEGPDHDYLRELAQKHGVKDNVIFTGEISEEEKYQLYENCDIFIMPSRDIKGDVEGFGIVYLEAGLYEKSVIAGRSGGVVEAVLNGETGITVNPEDINEIANAVIKLLADHTLANKLGVQGRERASNEFNKEKQIGKIEKLLQ